MSFDQHSTVTLIARNIHTNGRKKTCRAIERKYLAARKNARAGKKGERESGKEREIKRKNQYFTIGFESC